MTTEQLIGWAIALGPLLVLLNLYVWRPKLDQAEISSAHFFKDLVAVRQPRGKARWTRFRGSSVLLVEAGILFLLSLVLRGVYLEQMRMDEEKRVGVWVVLDTSASMSTRHGSLTRMDLARAEAGTLVSHLAGLQADDVDVCLNTLVLDQELTLRNIHLTLDSVSFDDIAWRPLGTDLTQIRQLLARLAQSNMDEMACPMTHLVVISDMAAPSWVTQHTNTSVVWRDIGQPASNVGIVGATQSGGLLGSPVRVIVNFQAYDVDPTAASTVTVSAPDGTVTSYALNWELGSEDTIMFDPMVEGDYEVSITETDDYRLDNQVTLRVRPASEVRIDWQIADREPSGYLLNPHWERDSTQPDVRITRWPGTTPDGVPTLYVGAGFDAGEPAARITYFDESSTLLDNLDFDVAETLGMAGLDWENIDPLNPILVNNQGQVWIAAGSSPLAVYIPGLPLETKNDVLAAFSMTVYYNALRWLMQVREPPPLYTLTSPAQPTIEANRAPLYPNEGNTASEHLHWREITSIQPVTTDTSDDPWWPFVLTCVCVLFLWERAAYLWGSR